MMKFAPLLISALIVITYSSCSKNEKNQHPKKFSLSLNQNFDYNNILVTYIADGDTIKLEDGAWVRLIGIDTPEYHDSEKLIRQARSKKKDIAEIKKMGAIAYAFTKEMLENKRVRLEFDVEKYDKYNRTLAYVYLNNDANEIFANAKIVESGYAQVMTIPPNVKYADLFIKLQRQAKESRRGFWANDY